MWCRRLSIPQEKPLPGQVLETAGKRKARPFRGCLAHRGSLSLWLSPWS